MDALVLAHTDQVSSRFWQRLGLMSLIARRSEAIFTSLDAWAQIKTS